MIYGSWRERFETPWPNGEKGLSVLALDPGETTGWAWACVPIKALLRTSASDGSSDSSGSSGSGDPSLVDGSWAIEPRFDPVKEALSSAQLHKSGFQFGDRMFMAGQISVKYGNGRASQLAEVDAIREIVAHAMMLDNMTRRVSAGAMRGLSDIVAEDFILRERTAHRSLLAPVRMTAGLLVDASSAGTGLDVTFHLQSPSDAKSVVNDQMLRDHGCWIRGQDHARDACRHLILFLRRSTVILRRHMSKNEGLAK